MCTSVHSIGNNSAHFFGSRLLSQWISAVGCARVVKALYCLHAAILSKRSRRKNSFYSCREIKKVFLFGAFSLSAAPLRHAHAVPLPPIRI